MRFKNRYLLCDLQFDDGKVDQSLSQGYIFRTIQSHVENYLGEWGAGTIQQSFNLKYYNSSTGLLILRVARSHYRAVWNCLPTLTQLKERKCILKCIHIGGTIRSCQKIAIQYNRSSLISKERAKVLTPAQIFHTIRQSGQDDLNKPPTFPEALRNSNPGVPLVNNLLVDSVSGEFTVVHNEETAILLTKTEEELRSLDES